MKSLRTKDLDHLEQKTGLKRETKQKSAQVTRCIVKNLEKIGTPCLRVAQEELNMNKFHFFSRAILILCSGMIASQFAHATTGVVPSDNDSILAIQPGDRIVLQNQLVLSCKAGDTQVSASSSSESNGVDVIMIEDWQPPKKPCRQSQVRIFEPGEVLYVAQAIPSGGPDEDYIVRGKSRYFRVLRAVPNGKSDSVAYERYSLEVRVFGERDMQTTTIGDLRRGFNWAFYITH